MKFWITSLLLLISIHSSFGQDAVRQDSLRKAYFADMRNESNTFVTAFYPHRSKIYAFNENHFISKIDSLKQPFLAVINTYSSELQPTFISEQQRDIDYFFDKFILDYPYFHEIHTSNKTKLSRSTQVRLNQHLKDFNNPDLLSSTDFQGYVQSFLRHQSSLEVRKPAYKKSDNKRLDAYLNLIPTYFTNQDCKDYWNYHYLQSHLDDWGSKNIGEAVQHFRATCQNASYVQKIDSLYLESVNSYQGHLIKTYKTVKDVTLDLHIFLPDSATAPSNRPAIVYFSGGSWTKGTPEWDFYNCAAYAKKGWVAIAVEYRVADRHETTPFEAVKDARSAIRWLRMNAATFHIDPNRIVATGNSAGGHLVLNTALATDVNESSDNLTISPVPNLLLVNGGVYNIYFDNSTDWISRNLKDKSDVKNISPQQLLRKGLPPMLIAHGTNDQSVNIASAQAFAEAMKQLGNEVEFHTFDGAPHTIWYDRRYSGRLAVLRKEFLKKYGYE